MSTSNRRSSELQLVLLAVTLLAASTGCGEDGPASPATGTAGSPVLQAAGSAAAAGAGAGVVAAVSGAGALATAGAAGGDAAIGGASAAASAGMGAAQAGVGAGAGNAVAGSSGSAGSPDAAGAAGEPGAAGTGAAPAPSALPPITDPAAVGPFGSEVVSTAPGLTSHMLYVPGKLGEGGLKHPVIVWTNGATGTASFYDELLKHFASHGFFMVTDKSSGGTHDPEIVEQKAGIDWAIAENARMGSPYFGKLDVDRIGVAGHSLGSIASYASAAHPSVKASIHWSSGLTGNPVGADEAWLQGLHAPAAFFCGGNEPRALPRCEGDFMNAPKIPVFYGTVAGVTHTSEYDKPRAGQWGRGGVAWMRWALAGDETFRAWFNGPTCELCKDPWTGMSRGL
jgi:hypothetical protein